MTKWKIEGNEKVKMNTNTEETKKSLASTLHLYQQSVPEVLTIAPQVEKEMMLGDGDGILDQVLFPQLITVGQDLTFAAASQA